MSSDIELVVNHIMQVSNETMTIYKDLMITLTGMVLGGILVAVLASKGKAPGSTEFNCLRAILSTLFAVLSVVCFFILIYGLTAQHTSRKDFCHKWLANNIPVKCDETVSSAKLLKQFHHDYYLYTCPESIKDDNSVQVNHEEILNRTGLTTGTFGGEFFQTTRGNIVIFAAGLLSVVCFIIAQASSRDKPALKADE